MIVTTDAMSGMIMHREDRIRPGGTTRDIGCCRCRDCDERDKNQGMTSANNAAGSGADTATLVPVGDAATEKDAKKRRLGERHRLLNSRKGSLSATFKKNAKTNDKAYDLNQKTMQALDALAADHIAFEATVANVTSEREAGGAMHAAAAETAGELERVHMDQGRLQDDQDCSCDDLAAATREFSDCSAAHEATSAKLCNACREVCNRRATHEAICVEARKALHRTYEIKRKASEIQRPGDTQGANKTHLERARQSGRPRQ